MNKNKWLLLAAATLTLGACSSDKEINEPPQEAVPILLSSSLSLDLQTRAADPYTSTQNTALADNEKVYAWVDEVSGTADYIKAWELTQTSTAGTVANSKIFSGATKNYPVSGNAVNIFAVHGNFTGVTAETTPFPASLTHTVSTAQNTSNNYEISDFLFASALSCARQTGAHNLEFAHILSKIEVYLVAGAGLTDADLETATVSILNTIPEATVTLSRTVAPTVAATTAAVAPIVAKMQTNKDAGATPMYPTVTISSNTYNVPRMAEAIIVPQTVGASATAPADFIQITIGSDTYKAQLYKQFESGYKYIYNVVVNKNGLVLSSTITQWTAGGTENINALP